MKKKKIEKTRDLEKKLLLKSETLRRLDLTAVTAGGIGEVEPACAASCPWPSCGCTGTYEG